MPWKFEWEIQHTFFLQILSIYKPLLLWNLCNTNCVLVSIVKKLWPTTATVIWVECQRKTIVSQFKCLDYTGRRRSPSTHNTFNPPAHIWYNQIQLLFMKTTFLWHLLKMFASEAWKRTNPLFRVWINIQPPTWFKMVPPPKSDLTPMSGFNGHSLTTNGIWREMSCLTK